MANRVLGIEIGQNLTRVVEIDYKTKNPKVHSMFSFPTPPEMIDDGVVHADSIFRSMLYSKIKEKKINTNKVVFTLNSTGCKGKADKGSFADECIGLFSGGFKSVQTRS